MDDAHSREIAKMLRLILLLSVVEKGFLLTPEECCRVRERLRLDVLALVAPEA